MPTRSENTHRHHHLSDDEFRRISAIAKRTIGLNIEIQKKNLVESRLTKRIRDRGLQNFSEYIDELCKPASTEYSHLVSALTTNVTSFYRERHHFEMLEREYIPGLISDAQQGKRVRLWSAGCSTGQEAYSLAASILSVEPSATNMDIKIIATDIDKRVLEIASKGVYAVGEIENLEGNLQRRITTKKRHGVSDFTVRPEIQSMIQFREVNLTNHVLVPEVLDVIMCRNVSIYFDSITQSELWLNLVKKLKIGGTLCIGHSEKIRGPAAEHLKSVGLTSYIRSQ